VAFVEVADRVLHARFPQWDVGVGLVLGRRGALVVDTRASLRQGREVADLVRPLLGGRRVTHVVNTHVHFDHLLGNGAFTGASIAAHERVIATLDQHVERTRQACRADPEGHPPLGYTAEDLADLVATEPVAPDVAVGRSHRIDLGDREVVLTHRGRGHTDGDLVVTVADADVAFVGDLVESSAFPSLGPDSHPLEWPDTLAAHLATAGATVFVPGHGPAVDRAFVERQRAELALVVEVIRERFGAGLPLAEASAEPDSRLPVAPELLADAFARGYAALSAG
jgi:glyoxylase-like metal-dependent hydrolase (beta-lactamase superfamily II)